MRPALVTIEAVSVFGLRREVEHALDLAGLCRIDSATVTNEVTTIEGRPLGVVKYSASERVQTALTFWRFAGTRRFFADFLAVVRRRSTEARAALARLLDLLAALVAVVDPSALVAPDRRERERDGSRDADPAHLASTLVAAPGAPSLAVVATA
jgi:hypothetical protein